MDVTHRDRQTTYRFWHPQLNITFRGRQEWILVMQALNATGHTPRNVTRILSTEAFPNLPEDVRGGSAQGVVGQKIVVPSFRLLCPETRILLVRQFF